MKRIRIVQAAVLLAVAVVIASCGSSRDYRDHRYPPREQTSVSLVISAYPGLVISRHPSGAYYYRDPRGFVYWRGYGNRYYLDRRYMSRSYHNHQQYEDWRRHYGLRR
jgi:hypothetical protein